MQNVLHFTRDVCAEHVGIQVTQQEQHLKHQHATGPNRWHAAKPGKNVFAQYELNLKQQKCPGADRGSEGIEVRIAPYLRDPDLFNPRDGGLLNLGHKPHSSADYLCGEYPAETLPKFSAPKKVTPFTKARSPRLRKSFMARQIARRRSKENSLALLCKKRRQRSMCDDRSSVEG